MIRIHHNTAKRAAKAGLTLKVCENEVEVYDGDRMLASAPAANTALDQAIAKMTTVEIKQKVAKREVARVKLLEEVEAVEAAKPKGQAIVGSVIKPGFRELYAEHGGSSGDTLAAQLKKFMDDGGSIEKLGRANDAWNPAWRSLNPGMQRMNLGNVLRGRVRHGHRINWTI